MSMRTIRRDTITLPIFSWARNQLPTLSETERDAIDAGEAWWDADLFSGNPDWTKLLDTAPASLSDKEKAFLDGPCEALCSMLHDWEITRAGGLPDDVWKFMKKNRFFGMIIPEEYGDLGFSNFAHSEVVRRISTCSITAGVTVMVPNSLGPGELLLQFGTDEQRDYWLPRLANGQEVPAFALTSETPVRTHRPCATPLSSVSGYRLRLTWSEKVDTAPDLSKKGFGTRLIDASIVGELGGTIERTYADGVLTIVIIVPIKSLN